MLPDSPNFSPMTTFVACDVNDWDADNNFIADRALNFCTVDLSRSRLKMFGVSREVCDAG